MVFINYKVGQRYMEEKKDKILKCINRKKI